MGGIFSHHNRRTSSLQGDIDIVKLKSRIDELEKKRPSNIEDRLEMLESKADLNKDGIVTRQEMEIFMASQLKMREEELICLKRELTRVQTEYDKLRLHNDDLYGKIKKGQIQEIKGSLVSERAIQRSVNAIIDDPRTNIYGFPDSLERAMYERSAKLTLAGLEKIFDTVSFEIIGHRIRLILEPIDSTDRNDD